MDLAKALKKEECLWKQKSRIRWLATSDLNTRFFHLSTIIRQRHNSIKSLKNEERCWLQSRAKVGSHIINFFHKLYQSSGTEDLGMLEELIYPVITPADNLDLCYIPTQEEIKGAIFL